MLAISRIEFVVSARLTAKSHRAPTLLRRVLSWIASPLHGVLFLLILLVTHPLVIFAQAVFGRRGFYAILKLHNLLHLLNMKLAGTRIDVQFEAPLPETGAVIYVANHQSMYDIPFLIWFLRKRMPHFIAKIELKSFIPFISYALRNGGHLIIDRGDRRSSIEAIQEYAREMDLARSAVCIFPEGTRAKDGVLKKFKTGGLVSLIENMPHATVVPITLDGTWAIVRNKFCP
ncbi:MAG: 1-acyl-sn-glycerol-3-phosphate acyltransferase, partial [Bdellovibrionales bacterium]|nr:1-acyl-sn-glycerol-3-phosphate acyltransferase [Bdellovibrionales bacterium]